MFKNFKTRIASFFLTLVAVFGLFPVSTAFAAEDYPTGGWNQVATTMSVVNSSGTKIGTVYAGEGVTVLNYNGSANSAYIEYSATNGPKRGYVTASNLWYIGNFIGSRVAKVTSSSSPYYAPYGVHYAGSVSAGEYVSLLGSYDGWSYIEYNVPNAQRKRAFVPSNCLYQYGNPGLFYHYNQVGYYIPVYSSQRVYAGPDSSAYPDIGSISAADSMKVARFWRFYDGQGREMWYVSYPTSSGVKYGYIYYNA